MIAERIIFVSRGIIVYLYTACRLQVFTSLT